MSSSAFCPKKSSLVLGVVLVVALLLIAVPQPSHGVALAPVISVWSTVHPSGYSVAGAGTTLDVAAMTLDASTNSKPSAIFDVTGLAFEGRLTIDCDTGTPWGNTANLIVTITAGTSSLALPPSPLVDVKGALRLGSTIAMVGGTYLANVVMTITSIPGIYDGSTISITGGTYTVAFDKDTFFAFIQSPVGPTTISSHSALTINSNTILGSNTATAMVGQQGMYGLIVSAGDLVVSLTSTLSISSNTYTIDGLRIGSPNGALRFYLLLQEGPLVTATGASSILLDNNAVTFTDADIWNEFWVELIGTVGFLSAAGGSTISISNNNVNRDLAVANDWWCAMAYISKPQTFDASNFIIDNNVVVAKDVTVYASWYQYTIQMITGALHITNGGSYSMSNNHVTQQTSSAANFIYFAFTSAYDGITASVGSTVTVSSNTLITQGVMSATLWYVVVYMVDPFTISGSSTAQINSNIISMTGMGDNTKPSLGMHILYTDGGGSLLPSDSSTLTISSNTATVVNSENVFSTQMIHARVVAVTFDTLASVVVTLNTLTITGCTAGALDAYIMQVAAIPTTIKGSASFAINNNAIVMGTTTASGTTQVGIFSSGSTLQIGGPTIATMDASDNSITMSGVSGGVLVLYTVNANSWISIAADSWLHVMSNVYSITGTTFTSASMQVISTGDQFALAADTSTFVAEGNSVSGTAPAPVAAGNRVFFRVAGAFNSASSTVRLSNNGLGDGSAFEVFSFNTITNTNNVHACRNYVNNALCIVTVSGGYPCSPGSPAVPVVVGCTSTPSLSNTPSLSLSPTWSNPSTQTETATVSLTDPHTDSLTPSPETLTNSLSAQSATVSVSVVQTNSESQAITTSESIVLSTSVSGSNSHSGTDSRVTTASESIAMSTSVTASDKTHSITTSQSGSHSASLPSTRSSSATPTPPATHSPSASHSDTHASTNTYYALPTPPTPSPTKTASASGPTVTPNTFTSTASESVSSSHSPSTTVIPTASPTRTASIASTPSLTHPPTPSASATPSSPMTKSQPHTGTQSLSQTNTYFTPPTVPQTATSSPPNTVSHPPTTTPEHTITKPLPKTKTVTRVMTTALDVSLPVTSVPPTALPITPVAPGVVIAGGGILSPTAASSAQILLLLTAMVCSNRNVGGVDRSNSELLNPISSFPGLYGSQFLVGSVVLLTAVCILYFAVVYIVFAIIRYRSNEDNVDDRLWTARLYLFYPRLPIVAAVLALPGIVFESASLLYGDTSDSVWWERALGGIALALSIPLVVHHILIGIMGASHLKRLRKETNIINQNTSSTVEGDDEEGDIKNNKNEGMLDDDEDAHSGGDWSTDNQSVIKPLGRKQSCASISYIGNHNSEHQVPTPPLRRPSMSVDTVHTNNSRFATIVSGEIDGAFAIGGGVDGGASQYTRTPEVRSLPAPTRVMDSDIAWPDEGDHHEEMAAIAPFSSSAAPNPVCVTAHHQGGRRSDPLSGRIGMPVLDLTKSFAVDINTTANKNQQHNPSTTATDASMLQVPMKMPAVELVTTFADDDSSHPSPALHAVSFGDDSTTSKSQGLQSYKSVSATPQPTSFAEDSSSKSVSGHASVSGPASFVGPTSFGPASFGGPSSFGGPTSFGGPASFGPASFGPAQPTSFMNSSTKSTGTKSTGILQPTSFAEDSLARGVMNGHNHQSVMNSSTKSALTIFAPAGLELQPHPQLHDRQRRFSHHTASRRVSYAKSATTTGATHNHIEVTSDPTPSETWVHVYTDAELVAVPHFVKVPLIPLIKWGQIVSRTKYCILTVYRPEMIAYMTAHNVVRVFLISILAAINPGTAAGCNGVRIGLSVLCFTHAILVLCTRAFRIPIVPFVHGPQSILLGLVALVPFMGGDQTNIMEGLAISLLVFSALESFFTGVVLTIEFFLQRSNNKENNGSPKIVPMDDLYSLPSIRSGIA